MSSAVHHTEPPLSEAPKAPLPPVLRSYEGWALVTVILTFLIVSQLLSYFGQERSASQSAVETTSLRLSLSLGTLQRSLAPRGAAAAKGTGNDAQGSLNTLQSRSSAEGGKNEGSALLEALIAYEHGEPVSDPSLNNLQDSKDAGTAAYIQAIRQSKLTPEQARAASAKIKGDSFDKQLMRTQLAHRSGEKEAYKQLFPPERTAGMMLVMAAGALAGLLGLGVLGLAAIQMANGKWPTKGLPTEPFLPSDADRFALRFGLYLLIYLAVGLVFGLALSVAPIPNAAKMMIILGSVGAATLVMIQTKLFGVGRELPRVLGDLSRWPQHVAVGAAAFLANIPIIAVLAVLTQILVAPFQQYLPSPSHPANEIISQGGILPLIFLYITAGIFAPVFEEITFRGLLFPALRRFMPLAGALLLQGFAFAAIHPQGPQAWPMLASVGIVAAYVAHKQGSLLPAIVMHLIHNTAILTFGLVIM